jgi:hypothetical protein
MAAAVRISHLQGDNLVGLFVTSFVHHTVSSSAALSVLFNLDVPIHLIYKTAGLSGLINVP